MVRFGLVGGVLGHSLSALIHQKLFEIKNLSGEYENYETADADKKRRIKRNIALVLLIPTAIFFIFFVWFIVAMMIGL